MNDIMILWNETQKIETLFIYDFYKKFNIGQVRISDLDGWQEFLKESKLPDDFVPEYNQSGGFEMRELLELDSLSYIENTDCCYLDVYYFNGMIFATPYQESMHNGYHLTAAFEKLMLTIEEQHNCKIFYRA